MLIQLNLTSHAVKIKKMNTATNKCIAAHFAYTAKTAAILTVIRNYEILNTLTNYG